MALEFYKLLLLLPMLRWQQEFNNTCLAIGLYLFFCVKTWIHFVLMPNQIPAKGNVSINHKDI